MTNDRQVIEDYFLKNDDGSWALTVKQIYLVHKLSKAGLYKVLKRNNIITRDRKQSVDLEGLFDNLERVIKQLRKALIKARREINK